MSYGTIIVGRLKDAYLLPNVVWKVGVGNNQKIPYTKYNIKETDFRIKTATFTSPQYLDLTTGAFDILIYSKYHENFAGRILDVEYDEDTGLYNYQCQDWSRAKIGKVESIFTDAETYPMLEHYLTNGRIPYKASKKEKERYKSTLSGLRPIGLYEQSLYPGNMWKGNPMKARSTFIARDKSIIEIIRSIIWNALGYFDIWFSDRGILQIEPISKTDWETTGLHLKGDYYNRKFKFSTTNAITGVIVNGTDLTRGSIYADWEFVGLYLTAFFGRNTASISNPINNTNAVASSNSSSTKKTTTTTSNPFNNKAKKIIVSADRGSNAESFKSGIISKLKADGWTVNDLGVGPGTHSRSYDILDKSYAVNLTIYNGADPATIAEPVTGWLAGKHEKYGVQLVQMWDTDEWTNPDGMKPYRYGNFDGYYCHKAWDDNYSSGNVDIPNLGSWFKKYYPKVIHVCGPSVSEAYSQFKAGGYLKSKGLVK